jgi:hypothetical protein
MNQKSKLEEKKISDKSSINIYISEDEKNYIFEISYLQGKFISQRIFSNDFDGIAKMEETKDAYKTEYDIKEYFGIV